MPNNGRPTPVANVLANSGGADLSPDGKWLAFDSAEAGERHVHVQAYPGPGPRFAVSTQGGGLTPIWRGDGRELFYLRPAAGATRDSGDVELAVMSVAVTPSPKLTLSAPRVLFSGRYVLNWPAHGYDATRDGQRFFLSQFRMRPPDVITAINRSEERRVGKECRVRGSPYDYEKKKENMKCG